jgi:hypothetical protein
VTPSVGWLRVIPTSGASGGEVTVEVDVTGLNAGDAPLDATITLGAPSAIEPIQVPVRLNLAC